MIRCLCFSTVTHLKTIHLILFFFFSCLPVIQACCPNRRKVHKEGRYPSGLNLRWMSDALFIYWMLFWCAVANPSTKYQGYTWWIPSWDSHDISLEQIKMCLDLGSPKTWQEHLRIFACVPQKIGWEYPAIRICLFSNSFLFSTLVVWFKWFSLHNVSLPSSE